jgi:hypothetical protein
MEKVKRLDKEEGFDTELYNPISTTNQNVPVVHLMFFFLKVVMAKNM